MASKSISSSILRKSIPTGTPGIGALALGGTSTRKPKPVKHFPTARAKLKADTARHHAFGAAVAKKETRPKNVKPLSMLEHPEQFCDALYLMNVLDRSDLLTQIPSQAFDNLCDVMGVTKEYLLTVLKLSTATLGRKHKSGAPLATDEAEKILGIVCLIGQVKIMVEESGEAEGFEAAKWFAQWIKSPNATLGGRRADELLSFGDGRHLLSDLLCQMQAGTYA